jgi:hypothetical protein
MTRLRIGVAAALGVAAAITLSGRAIPAQQQTSLTSASPVHSVTITLAPADDGTTCEIKGLTPETRAVYKGDTLVWHVENGCKVRARVRVTNVTLVQPRRDAEFKGLQGGQNWPEGVEVDGGRRAQITALVAFEPPDATKYVLEYTVRAEAKTGSPRDITGAVMMCREPPCWPPIRPLR